MLVDEKPSLDEDLLIHFGIKGMRWGVRKPDYIPVGRSSSAGVNYGSHPNVRRAANPSGGASAPRPRTPQKQGMSKGKKIAIGVGVVGGAAAAAYFLSKTGTRPHAQAMTSRSNRLGLKMAMGTLKTSGKVSVKGLKVGGKVAKVGAKAGYKTGKVVGKGAVKGGRSVAVNSYKGATNYVQSLKGRPPSGPSVVRGEKFGKLLLGEYGPGSSSGGVGIINVRRRKH